MATLTDLINQTRQRINLEQGPYVIDSDPFVTDAEITNYINEAIGEVHEELVLANENYYTISATASVASGNTFPLPADCFKTKLLQKLTGSGTDGYTNIHEFSLEEMDTINGVFNWQGVNLASCPRYSIFGNTVYLEPANVAVGTYRIWYAPDYVPLVSGSDTITFPSSWISYVVIYAAIQIRIKSNLGSIDDLQMQALRFKERIMTGAARRGQPRRVQDVTSRRTWRSVRRY